ncbi:MAG: DUF229 domain-containing protein [Planctomycetes bacterium]|nr:DUF229 domain-containing protein [Planctomycetota bacterium]
MSYYWALVTLIDEQIGRIMQALTERGLWQNTLVLFVTDHGEMLGDFGRGGKANFYEAVIRSPFIVTVPGGHAPPRQVDDLVETMDIAPTILDYAGLPVPPEMQAKSLRPLLEGKGRGKEAILCEYTSNDRQVSGKCVRTRRYKYCFWGQGRPEQFYDLQEDAHERRDAISDPRYRVEIDAHRRLMLDILSDAGARHVPRP